MSNLAPKRWPVSSAAVHNIQPDVSPENVVALFQAARAHTYAIAAGADQ